MEADKTRFVPETKNLSLEEMDIIFGSAGVSARDKEIMDEVNREVGLFELAGVHGRTEVEKTVIIEEKDEKDS